MDEFMTTGHAAREIGITSQLLRWHEQQGHIPTAPRATGVNGTRLYSREDIERLRAWREGIGARKETPRRSA